MALGEPVKEGKLLDGPALGGSIVAFDRGGTARTEKQKKRKRRESDLAPKENTTIAGPSSEKGKDD